MLYSFLADFVLVVHLAFLLFVVLGSLLAMRWPRAAWIHVPAALWGILIEFADLTCPLTPLEVHFRRLAGQSGYPGGFIDHYLVRVLYPPGLTPALQAALGSFALLLNLVLYSWIIARRLGERRQGREGRKRDS